MMSHEDAERFGRRACKGVTDEGNLVLVDAAVLEGERTGGVDSKHGQTGQFDKWAQALVDEAAVARQRREEAPKHVVQRNVVVTGHGQNFVPSPLEPFEEAAGLL